MNAVDYFGTPISVGDWVLYVSDQRTQSDEPSTWYSSHGLSAVGKILEIIESDRGYGVKINMVRLQCVNTKLIYFLPYLEITSLNTVNKMISE